MKLNYFHADGLGNDFIVIDGRLASVALTPGQIRALADRNHGLGADQVIVLEPPPESAIAPAIALRIYNADGGAVGMCGNAARCIAKFMFEDAPTKQAVTIFTTTSKLSATRDASNIAVDMGRPKFNWRDVPLADPADTAAVWLDGNPLGLPAFCCNLGNPHATFLVPALDAINCAALGPGLEHHPMFPERANIGFAEIIDRRTIRLRVWERGAGLTKACGSGAAAALVAAVRGQFAERAATLLLDGGALRIAWRDDDHIVMTGPANIGAWQALPAHFYALEPAL